jgi:D-sedoheptulose 7-phosphate isomerase
VPKSLNNPIPNLEAYFTKVRKALDSIELKEIQNVFSILEKVRTNRQTLYIAGNGGSASTSQHFSVDLGVGGIDRNSIIRSISLSDNQSAITAIANDRNYREVFSAQLKVLGDEGDVLLVISASGNSVNLIEAVLTAKSLGMTTIGLLGFNGGELRLLCDYSILVETDLGEYGIVEDIHLSICHNLTEVLRITR